MYTKYAPRHCVQLAGITQSDTHTIGQHIMCCVAGMCQHIEYSVRASNNVTNLPQVIMYTYICHYSIQVSLHLLSMEPICGFNRHHVGQCQEYSKSTLNNVPCCRHVPTHVKQLGSIRMRQVSCGWRHSAGITTDGSVYTFGWSKYGQLGHGTYE